MDNLRNQLRSLLHSVGDILSARNEDNDLHRRHAYRRGGGGDDDPSLSTIIDISADGSGSDVGSDDGDYETTDISRFLTGYKASVADYFGRPLEWTTDLLFNMQQKRIGSGVYWIMDITHPASWFIEQSAREARRTSPAVMLFKSEFNGYEPMVQAMYRDSFFRGILAQLIALFERYDGVTLRTVVVDTTFVPEAVYVPPKPILPAAEVEPAPVATVRPSEGGKKKD
jgi:hypothetical protein